MRPFTRAAALAGAALLLPSAPALADPAGRSTLDETIRVEGGYGKGPWHPLVRGPGERHVVRTALAPARRSRVRTRRSLAFFGQITDPQIADETSPARVELLDPAGGPVASAHRPQEALGVHVFDATIRNLNRNRTSTVRQGDRRRARMQFAITTGDLADSMQRNEARWMVRVLEGGRVDPFSGKPVGPGNACPGATPAELASIADDVANRRYTGVQDYDDYRGAPPERQAGFWDPDEAPPAASPYATFPRWPGLMDRAQRPFTAEGLRVPWYSSRGNHDGLVQGTVSASEVLFQLIVNGCQKIYPTALFDPASIAGRPGEQIFSEIGTQAFAQTLLSGAGRTAPDPDRAFVSKREYKRLQGRGDVRHGFGLTSRRELRASDGTALYYSFAPRSGLRMVSLDTVAEGGGSEGNVDHPQYRWLQRTLRAAARRDELVIVYSHHTLGTTANPTPDEQAGCTDPGGAGCDGDPRRSTPIHLGIRGRASIRDLLLSHPHVIAYVNGHTHRNDVRAYRRGRHGFWQVNTAAHIDFPQQSRQLELMDNRDGTLSLFGTILDTAAPIAAPTPGPAAGLTDRQLGSLARTLAANDPQARQTSGGGGPGDRSDRNVELLIRDPR